MKDLLKKWESETGIKITEWRETEIIKENALYIHIENYSITMHQIKRLNTMLKQNGYYYTFDNLDIYNGNITLWFW